MVCVGAVVAVLGGASVFQMPGTGFGQFLFGGVLTRTVFLSEAVEVDEVVEKETVYEERVEESALAGKSADGSQLTLESGSVFVLSGRGERYSDFWLPGEAVVVTKNPVGGGDFRIESVENGEWVIVSKDDGI